ncbi:MAG: hypothetical protein M3619_00655 [Myxococcota bacterium]|nr:hypothetical protein [Myxococcota bacterium]
MKIRLATFNTPLFTHAGLNLTERWREVDTDELGPEGRDAIEKYTGHIVQVHPDDLDKLVQATDLEFEDGKFRYPGGPEGAEGKTPIGERHQKDAAAKADDADAKSRRKKDAAAKAGEGAPVAVTASETRNMGNAVEVSKTGEATPAHSKKG